MTQTELDLGWTKIERVPRVSYYVHLLFGGIWIDASQGKGGYAEGFGMVRKVFESLCIPFYTRFVGAYDLDRLAEIPDASAATKLREKLSCNNVEASIAELADGQYRAKGESSCPRTHSPVLADPSLTPAPDADYDLVQSHSRILGNGTSVYKAAAVGFAYREALKYVSSGICNCRSARPAPPPEHPPLSVDSPDDCQILDSSPFDSPDDIQILDGIPFDDPDYFQILDGPPSDHSDRYEIGKDPGPPHVVPATRKASPSDLEDSDGQERKNKRVRYDT